MWSACALKYIILICIFFYLSPSCFIIFLHTYNRLPIPRPGEVLGLVGTNGIGKSTALKILAGKQKPNLGKYDVCIPPYENEYVGQFFETLKESIYFFKCYFQHY